ncbi:hypothetical protein BWQ96_08724 [Gracilariopsis chorda]|uniref:Uncharacterized protein n=1 Tax=Gracilariopsis chorda TaxID=448386 RepID=A0A2V3IHF6_9FLOR|nr:hypothetical protein BWQ96_08724 [Gracilariopsis chorda]|eukprot:PXF41521.1 hypothetical protein BWQ96_08724 [Gracilariopsis chorda]
MAMRSPRYADLRDRFETNNNESTSELNFHTSLTSQRSGTKKGHQEQKNLPLVLRAGKRERDIDVMFLDVCEELLKHIRVTNPNVAGTLSVSDLLYDKAGVGDRITREVLRREVGTILGQIRALYDKNAKSRGLAAEEYATVSALQRQLREARDLSRRASVDLKLAQKRGQVMEDTVAEYSASVTEYKSRMVQMTEEIEDLRAQKGVTIRPCIEATCSRVHENEKLNEVISDLKKKLVQGEHELAMARLEAKHVALQAQQLETRLKEADFCAELVSLRINQLQEVHKEIERTLATPREASDTRSGRFKLHNLVQRGKGILARIGSLLPGNWGNDREENANHDVELPDDDVAENERNINTHENQVAPRGMMQVLLHPVRSLLRSDPNSSPQVPLLRRILTGERTEQAAQSTHVADGHDDHANSPQTRSSNATIEEMVARSQEAHKKDMKTLRKVILRKQKEIDRLHGQLTEAAKHVAELERALRRERQRQTLCARGDCRNL